MRNVLSLVTVCKNTKCYFAIMSNYKGGQSTMNLGNKWLCDLEIIEKLNVKFKPIGEWYIQRWDGFENEIY